MAPVNRSGKGGPDPSQLLTPKPQPGQSSTGQTVSSTIAGGGSFGPIPVMGPGMTFSEVGSSGLRAFSGWVREEFLPALVGRQGPRVYREMMDNNAIIGGIMFAIMSTMRKVDWRVVPADEDGPDQQVAIDFIESLREDMSHTWEDTVIDDLSMLPYGYAFKEIVYKRCLGNDPGKDPTRPGRDLPKSKYDDGKIRWRKLALRGQDTILKWFFDENGATVGVTQQPWVGPTVDIPIEKGLLFRPVHWKGNPEGRSILRSAYRSYFFTKRLEEQEAIMLERLNGLPIVRVPQSVIAAASAGDPQAVAAMNNWKKIAVNVRIDEQMGLVMPSDTWPGINGPSTERMYNFELITPTGSRGSVDSSKMIDRYSVNMMTCVMADFLSLGHSARGTQALANQKTDMFFQAIEGFLNANAAVYNRHGIPRVFELNGMPTDNLPQLEPDLAQRIDLDILSNFVLRLSQSGAPLFPNEELQSYLMDAAGMPDVLTPEALEFAGMTDELIANDTEQALNPPQPAPVPAKPVGKLQKMLAASIARRIIRHSGNKYEMREKRKRRHGRT